MTKPVTIPNTFATATTAIPLSQLDSDFSTVATALNDANTYSNYAADTGVANAYVVTLSGVSTTYSAGLRIQFKAGAANTGASTLNVNGGGTKNITFQDASALSSGTIAANAIVDVMYDGTQFLLMNDPAGATGGDVVGPASATDNAIVRFDGATGKLVQNSVVTIADSTGDISGVGTLNATTLDATNIEVTNIKAKDGTAAASIADSTGVISVTANPVLSGGTANGVLYLNGSKVATSGSALTFDGSKLTVKGGSAGQLVLDNANEQYVQALFQRNATANTGADLLLDGSGNTFNFRNLAANMPFVWHLSASAGAPTEQMRLTSTGLKSSIAGTNADPVFSYTSDTNTGIFFPAADKLGFTAGGGTDDMVLTTTGLGIGTSSPSYKLDVSGYIRGLVNTSSVGNASSMQLTQNGTGDAAVSFLIGSTTEWLLGVDNSASDAFKISNITGGSDFTSTGIVLDTSGNLGLGVTPSAWQGAFDALQFGDYAGIGSSREMTLFANAYQNSAGNGIYQVSSLGASKYDQYNGVHAWYIAPSGTAGNAITFTQAMTLDASGNLGLGTTSPNSYGNTTTFTINGTTYSEIDFEVGGTLQAYINGISGGLEINADGSRVIVLRTNNTERARITSGGYFKASDNGTYLGSTGTYHEINQSANDNVLFIRSTSTAYSVDGVQLRYNRNTTNNTFYALSYYNDAAGAYKLRIADSGDVTNTNGTYGTISDAKMKTDIVDAGSQWADVKAIRFRKFKMKDDPSGLVQLGVVAQELEQTSPGLIDEHVDRDADGNDLGTTTKSVKTSILLMKAAKALQEAMARIETLEAKVSALEGN